LWKLLIEGRDAVGVPASLRWQWPGGIEPAGKHAGIDHAAYLEDIMRFDAGFFRISPREAELMDPQQRLLLELSWECLEDAGLRAAAVAGTRTGVYVGASGSDYRRVVERALDAVDAHVGIGSAMSVIPNRISYFYDFRGPSLHIDTACSPWTR
jgi:polyketide synthase PksN